MKRLLVACIIYLNKLNEEEKSEFEHCFNLIKIYITKNYIYEIFVLVQKNK